MKPFTETRSSFSSATESASFGISHEDEAHILGLLRDGIYTDKVLAVLREYSANAWDAHRMAGRGGEPISVTVPTREDPTLKIRDHGPGLSHDDVFTVFSQYGRSTKRETNDAVGSLGIGSKAGFAYSDSFIVTSWYDGKKRIYMATLDESEKGKISLLAEEPADGSGVEIQIAVRPEDISEFQSKAKQLFRHFYPRPTINLDLPAAPTEQTILANGSITTQGYYGAEWIAIMGCVPYKVTLTQLDLTKISKCLPNLSGSLFFDIGDVAVSASREELRYTAATKTKLIQKFNDLVDEYVLHALEDLEKPGISSWDKRLKVQLLAKLELPLPEEYEALAFETAKVTYTPGTFVILHNTSVTTRITVTSRTRLLIDDTGKKLEHYYLGKDDYVVRGEGRTAADTQTLLEEALKESGLSGCKISLLSECQWNPPYVKPKKVVNPKHKAKMFTLLPSSSFSQPYSDHWETTIRVATSTDVYVLISGFQGDNYNFFADYRADARLAYDFGTVMPTVYGYKTSEKRPAVPVGVEYREWRKDFIAGLLTPDNLAKIQDYYWANPTNGYVYWPDKEDRKGLIKALGAAHQISELLSRQAASKSTSSVGILADRAGIKREDSDAGKSYSLIQKTYALLTGDALRNLWGSDSEGWIEYVQLIDARDLAAAALRGPLRAQHLDNAGSMLMMCS